jgi:hypothetical protein
MLTKHGRGDEEEERIKEKKGMKEVRPKKERRRMEGNNEERIDDERMHAGTPEEEPRNG